MSKRPRISWSNVFVGVFLVWVGAYCSSGCASAQVEPQPVEPVSNSIMFLGLRPIVPDAIQRGIWHEVGECLQQDEIDPAVVRWALADYIVDIDRKQLLWGVVANVRWPEGVAYTAVVDRRVEHSVRVWSHELVHVRADVPDGDWHLDACTFADGPYILPLRPLTDEQIAALTGGP